MNINLRKGRGKYQITVESRQFVLKKLRQPRGKEHYYENIGFYQSIEGVARKLLQEAMLTLDNHNDIVEAITEAKELIQSELKKGMADG